MLNNNSKFNLIGINVSKDIYNINNPNILSLEKFIIQNKHKISTILYHDSAEYYVENKTKKKLDLIEHICSLGNTCYYLGPRVRPNINYINLLKRIKKNMDD